MSGPPMTPRNGGLAMNAQTYCRGTSTRRSSGFEWAPNELGDFELRCLLQHREAEDDEDRGLLDETPSSSTVHSQQTLPWRSFFLEHVQVEALGGSDTRITQI